jgi:hypothetical protein
MSIWTDIDNFLKGTVEPAIAAFFKTAETDLVTALTPIATSAVSQLSTALIASAGNPTAFATAAGQVLTSIASQAEAAGIEATGAAILSTASTAIAALQPTATATVTATPVTPPAS